MTIKYGVVTSTALWRNVDSLSHFLLDFHGILHFYCKVRSPQKNGSQVYSTHFLLCWGPTWQLREKQVKVWWNFSNKIELECSALRMIPHGRFELGLFFAPTLWHWTVWEFQIAWLEINTCNFQCRELELPMERLAIISSGADKVWARRVSLSYVLCRIVEL